MPLAAAFVGHRRSRGTAGDDLPRGSAARSARPDELHEVVFTSGATAWLNELDRDGNSYRLPTPSQAPPARPPHSPQSQYM